MYFCLQKIINPCRFKPFTSWSFVTAATGSEYRFWSLKVSVFLPPFVFRSKTKLGRDIMSIYLWLILARVFQEHSPKKWNWRRSVVSSIIGRKIFFLAPNSANSTVTNAENMKVVWKWVMGRSWKKFEEYDRKS